MPSQRRDELLTEKERDRLTNRQDMTDKKTRAANDIRVRKKLASWFKNIGDVLLILQNLPEDQIRDITSDPAIYLLFNIIEDLLVKRKFYPIEGKADNPDDWKIVINENTKRAATNSDVIRSSLLGYYIDNLKPFRGENNPIGKVEFLETLDEHPDYHDRVTEEDRKAIKRLNQARDEFYKDMGWPLKESRDIPK